LEKATLAMDFLVSFVSMTMLLFQDARALVKVNGVQSQSFPIQRGVQQGHPLAPYLFLIVVEVLNLMVKEGVSQGVIKGIKSLVEDCELPICHLGLTAYFFSGVV